MRERGERKRVKKKEENVKKIWIDTVDDINQLFVLHSPRDAKSENKTWPFKDPFPQLVSFFITHAKKKTENTTYLGAFSPVV